MLKRLLGLFRYFDYSHNLITKLYPRRPPYSNDKKMSPTDPRTSSTYVTMFKGVIISHVRSIREKMMPIGKHVE